MTLETDRSLVEPYAPPPTRGALRDDIKRTYDLAEGRSVRRVIECLRAPGVHAVVVYRFGQWLQMQPKVVRVFLEPVYLVLNALIQIMWGIELPRSAVIGAGFYIGHFGGITIAAQAKIGKRCSISQSVTIGVAGHGEK